MDSRALKSGEGGPKPGANAALARRAWMFRLAAAVLVPVLVLSGLELALRLIGYGYPTTFFQLLQIDGKDYLVENDKFGWRFFPPEIARSPAPVKFPQQKAPGTCRIFILGESAALGDPRPAFGAGRYLQVLLEERYPGRRFEVICAAMTAINSHALLDIARECARRQGDLWIIYMGNNEMVGPFGAATVFGPKTPGHGFVRLSLELQRTKVGQLFTAWGRKLKRPPGQSWTGMEMFTSSRVAPGDPKRDAVYRNFRANLEGIVQAGLGSGARVVLNTVAVNLKDSPPFASVPSARLTETDRAVCDRLVEAGAVAASQTNYSQAAQALAQAASVDPQRADLQFYLGECLLSMTNIDAARQHFERACDLDALPFRADSTINGLLADAGRRFAGQHLVFFDATEAMAGYSGVRIPGNESFYEHVHYNFDGNYRLARGWAQAAAALLPELGQSGPGSAAPVQAFSQDLSNGTVPEKRLATNQVTDAASPAGLQNSMLSTAARMPSVSGWASQEICEERLGLTDWNRASVFEDMVRRFGQPPLSAQANNGRRREALRARWLQLREHMDQAAAARARAIYLEALNRSPEDERLHENFAEFLESVGEIAPAQEQWERVRELIPQHHLAYFETGRLALRQGQIPEARRRLLQAVTMRPDLGEGWLELGNIESMTGKPELAMADYQRAKDLTPQDPRNYYHLGKTFSKLGRPVEAMQQLRKATQLRPEYWEAHYALGEELGFVGMVQEARRELEETLRLKPDFAMAHLNLGVALAREGNLPQAIKQIQEAQRLDPKDPLPAQYLEKLKTLSATPATTTNAVKGS